MIAAGHPAAVVKPGTLYVCGTPIGNLDDLTIRAAAVLAAVDLILAEDTRRARKLSSRYPLGGKLVSCHAHNERTRATQVAAVLAQGGTAALITDAGTPGLSDPGAQLVAAVTTAGYDVIPVPGPSAAAAALSVSGFAQGEFHFIGFFPRARRQRQAAVDRLALADAITIFFEAPTRIIDTIELLAKAFPQRPVLVAREMTKVHETYLRGALAEVALMMGTVPPRGEYTVVVGPAVSRGAPGADGTLTHVDSCPAEQFNAVSADLLHQEVALLTAGGLDELEAIRRVARGHGISRQAVYRIVRGS